MIRAATVVSAVRDVAGLSFPVLLALAVHTARHRVRCAASAVARTVVRARVYPGGQRIRKAWKFLKVISALLESIRSRVMGRQNGKGQIEGEER